jgi:hypothetical protein
LTKRSKSLLGKIVYCYGHHPPPAAAPASLRPVRSLALPARPAAPFVLGRKDMLLLRHSPAARHGPSWTAGERFFFRLRHALKTIVSHRCGSSVFSQKGWLIMQALSGRAVE